MSPPFRLEALGAIHDRKNFDSGSSDLDRYLRERATQDVRRRFGNCFVVIAESGEIAGYYTLSATSVALSELPQDVATRLPRYPLVPAALVGRLAVATEFRGIGIGSAMILDAARRAETSGPAVYALVVEPKDEAALGFYRHLRFRELVERPDRLYLPLATALDTFNGGA